MKQYLLALTLTLSSLTFAQGTPDLRVLETQNTNGSPFAVPYLTPFTAMIHVGLQLDKVQYVLPRPSTEFSLKPIQDDDQWMELQNFRWEAGLGLGYLLKQGLMFGFTPFKGSLITTIRHKEKDAILPFITMPKTFDDISDWKVGDYGSFQTYGGVEVSVQMTVVPQVGTGLTAIVQSQFIVEFEKTSEDEVVISVAEENLEKRTSFFGPMVAKGTLDNFNGKRFTSRFHLNLKDREHEELFRKAIAGKIIDLQNFLPPTKQNILWQGHERYFAYGIPLVAMRTRYRGHYDVNVDGKSGILEVYYQRTNGVLAKLHNVKDFIYETEDRFWLLWMNEMSKVDGKGLREHFLTRGSIMGIASFNDEVDRKADMGSMLTQLSINFSREEMEKLKKTDIDILSANLLLRCQEMKLKCAEQGNFNKLMKRVASSLREDWPRLKSKLGDILIHEASVVYAIVKTLGAKKEAYFKFMSEKYQSMEGDAPIEF